MPIAKIQMPDGRIARFEVPEGTTPQQVESFATQSFGQSGAEPVAPPKPDAVLSAAGGGNAGLAGLAGLPVDTLLNVWDLAKAGYGTAATAAGRPDLAPEPSNRGEFFGSSEYIRDRMNDAGLVTRPASDSMADRYAFAGMSGAAGAMLSPTNVLPNLYRGAAGGMAAQGAMDATDDPAVAASAGLLASVSPQAAAATVRGAVRGGEKGREQMGKNLLDFQRLGVEPSIGQASGSRPMQAFESFLSKIPGSAGHMVGKAKDQQTALGGALDRIAGDMGPTQSPTTAGLLVERGIKQNFLPDFKAKQGLLYNKLDKFIAPLKPTSVDNTQGTLASLNAEIPGAPNLSRLFVNKRIEGIEGALGADVNQQRSFSPSQLKAAAENTDTASGLSLLLGEQKLPYQAVKQLRTLVGNEMADSGLLSDVPRSKWKPFYGALSDDLRGAAAEAGPDATKAFNRANTYTRAGTQRLEDIETVIDRAGGPEKVFKSVIAGTEDGATLLRSVMKSLPKEGKAAVASTMIRRMGRAKAGLQNAEGDVFSTETFLTNWNKMSPEARNTIAGPFGPKVRADLDSLARVASNLRDGSKVFANPSGTSSAGANIAGAGSLLTALGTGQLGVAGGLLAGAGAANAASRLMHNQTAVKFLAQETGVPIDVLRSQLVTLSQQREDNKRN